MTGDQTLQAIWFALALVLVGSALISHRIRLRSGITMALVWVAIFAVVLSLVSFRRELGRVADRVRTELTGVPDQRAEGRALHVAMVSDGHYWVEGSIDGTPARFLVDSGASITALSSATASRAGLAIDQQRVARVETANGPVDAQHAMVRELAVGAILTKDLPVVVAPQFGEVNVLGMNFLSRLKSWRVENGEMVLEP